MMKKSALLALLALLLCCCDSVNNKEVPQTMVRIDLGTFALWDTYGVTGAGDYRIFNRPKKQPSNFPYNVNTYTGYGGVLLMMGFEGGNYGPVAYDAACPVENRPDVSVGVDASNFDAVCPLCKSRYNVFNGGGGPISGQAATRKPPLGLRILSVRASDYGGYIITSY